MTGSQTGENILSCERNQVSRFPVLFSIEFKIKTVVSSSNTPSGRPDSPKGALHFIQHSRSLDSKRNFDRPFHHKDASVLTKYNECCSHHPCLLSNGTERSHTPRRWEFLKTGPFDREVRTLKSGQSV